MPIIPHFSNECLKQLEEDKNINWPSYDESILIENFVNIVIQINGKKRGLLTTDKDISENNLIEKILDEKSLKKYLDNNKIKKKIFIPNKLINIII